MIGKIKSIILFISVLILALLFIFVFDFNNNENEELPIYKEKKGIKGAAAWLHNIRRNPQTNSVDQYEVQLKSELARKFNRNKSQSVTWQSMGPDNIAGRSRAILVDNSNPNILYFAGVSGGLWKSTTGGTSWSLVESFDKQNFINISCIAQAESGDIYVGTGESFAAHDGVAQGNSGFVGGGLWKSSDQGNTWKRLDGTIPSSGNNKSEDWAFINEIAIDDELNRIYVATNNGLKYSEDEGETWSQFSASKYIEDVTVSSDNAVIFRFNDPSFLYTNYPYIIPKGVFDSIKRGSNPLDEAGKFPVLAHSFSRLEFAFAPQDPNYLYCSAADLEGNLKGVYRSTDAGLTWSNIAPGGTSLNIFNGQGKYNNVIAVCPKNKNRVLLGGIDLWEGVKVSEDGYFNWTPLSDWRNPSYDKNYIHADIHSVEFDQSNPDIVYVSSDGGISKSIDGGYSWKNINRGNITTQFYTLACNDKGHILGGTQDNGTLLIDYNGVTDFYAKEMIGGDGGSCVFSKINPEVKFVSAQHGKVYRVMNDIVDGTPSDNNLYDSYFKSWIDAVTAIVGENSVASFVTPFEYWEDPIDSNTTMIIGMINSLWMTKNPLEPNTKWFKLNDFQGRVQNMKISDDGNTLYYSVYKNDYKLYKITNLLSVSDSLTGEFGSSGYVANVSGNISPDTLRSITSITLNENDTNNMILTFGNYGYDNHVYETNNLSDSIPDFVSVQNDLPPAPVYCSMFSPAGELLVGTEFGVYLMDTSTNMWSDFKGNMPNVPVFAMCKTDEKAEMPNAVFIATHGRGIYKTSSYVNIEENKNSESSKILIYPNPVKEEGKVRFNISKTYDVTLSIFNIKGEIVYHKEYFKLSSGLNYLKFSSKRLSNGIYFVNVLTNEWSQSQKIVVEK